jgi:hypothetical protein
MRNVPDKSCRGNQNTHFLFHNVFFFVENRAVYQIMWKDIVEREKSQMTIWRMRRACCIPMATYTHSEYVNTYVFSTATVVMRTRLNVTLYVHWLSCSVHCGYNVTIFFFNIITRLLGNCIRWKAEMIMIILNEVLSIMLLVSLSAPNMTLSTIDKYPDYSETAFPQSVGHILGDICINTWHTIYLIPVRNNKPKSNRGNDCKRIYDRNAYLRKLYSRFKEHYRHLQPFGKEVRIPIAHMRL